MQTLEAEEWSKETKKKHVFAKYCKQDKSEPVSLKLENKPKE